MTSISGNPARRMVHSTCRLVFDRLPVAWFATRTRRRGLVAAYVVLLASVPALGWMTGSSWPVVALVGPLALAMLLLGAVTGGLFDRPAHSLDERERQVRDTVFPNPHLVGTGSGILAGLVIAASFGSDDPALAGLAVVISAAVFMVPTTVLAWRLPTAPDDGE